MNYKITRNRPLTPYQSVGYFGCSRTVLHQQDAASRLSMTTFCFHMGGGSEFKPCSQETLLYILSGEIALRTPSEQTVLRAGDSIHLQEGCSFSLFNQGEADCMTLFVETVSAHTEA